MGGGFIQTIYFGQIIKGQYNGQNLRFKADPGSNCHKSYKINDSKVIDEVYGCLIQVDMYSVLVKDLDL